MGKAAFFIIGGVLIAAGALGAGGYVLTQTPAGERLRERLQRQEPGTVVRVEPARRGQLTRNISAPGLVEPRRKVEISAQVSARIIGLPFEEGHRVRAGDVVVRLDAEDLTARLEAARARERAQEARLRGSQADLAVAQSDFGRRKELYESGDIARSEFEQAENRYNQAVAAVEMARADVEIARAQIIEAERDLAHAVITSPIDGVLTTLNAEEGELVVVGTLNTPGSIILEVADLGDMLLRARIDESNVAQVEPGQDATVHVNAYRDEPFQGVVERVGLERKRWQDGTYYYEAEIKLADDAERPLLSGMSATAEIAVQRLADVLVVPSQAVLDRRIDELPKAVLDAAGALIDRRKTFASVVYQIENGKAVAKPVEVGPSDLADTVILAGLTEGEGIITGPFKALVELQHDQAVQDEAEKDADEEGPSEGTDEAVAEAAAEDQSPRKTDAATASDDAGS